MNNRICLDTRIGILLIIMIIIVGVYQYCTMKNIQSDPSCPVCPVCPTHDSNAIATEIGSVTSNNNSEARSVNIGVNTNVDNINNSNDGNKTNVVVGNIIDHDHNHDQQMVKTVTPRNFNIDPVREYDTRKINDPLEQPTRRIPRHNIHPTTMRNMIDIQTHGYPDNFTQIGTLIRDGEGTTDSKILRLFGRQEFPSSTRYEYYTFINSGQDQIKVPITIKNNKELWEDDVVTVPELGYDYNVKLYKFDAPKYYPDVY